MSVDEVDPFLPEEQEERQALQAKRVEQAEDEVRQRIETVKSAYMRVFSDGTPSAEDRRIVLHDLEVFTRGERTPWDENERIHCLLTGRNEVYRRIHNYMRLSLDTLVVEAFVAQMKGK